MNGAVKIFVAIVLILFALAACGYLTGAWEQARLGYLR